MYIYVYIYTHTHTQSLFRCCTPCTAVVVVVVVDRHVGPARVELLHPKEEKVGLACDEKKN